MACCQKINHIPPDQQRIIKAVQDTPTTSYYTGSLVKSNRSPAGTIAKQCPNCGVKTIVSMCPICSTPLK